MARDNFTKAVIEKLQKRVAHRCSNPACRVPTIGPSSDSDSTTSIGVAAHITAAAPGGPRYDFSLTEKQRKSMGNGIWLCSNCSTVIDKDVDLHPVKLLNEWKQKAEALAIQELGKKLPDNEDAIHMLTTALTGQSNRIIANSIQNIHKASTSALEALDPRFTITSAYANGTTHFEFHAKEKVPLVVNVKGQQASEYLNKYRALINHGTELIVDDAPITIAGSKLLEEITTNYPRGNLKLTPPKHKATQKMWLLNKETSAIESFDDIQGNISIGKHSFTFTGIACDGIFNFDYRKSIDNRKPVAKMHLTIDFEKWSGTDVRVLPYFSKLYSFFEKMHAGWCLLTTLEVNGIELMRSKENVDTSFAKQLLDRFSIIKTAQSIAYPLNIEILFNPHYRFSEQEYFDLCDIASIANGTFVYYQKDIRKNMKSTLTIENISIDSLLMFKEPTDFKFVAAEEKELHLFGQLIKLPPLIMEIKAATPLITTTQKLDSLVAGDQIDVEWIPSDKFEYRVEFQKNTT